MEKNSCDALRRKPLLQKIQSTYAVPQRISIVPSATYLLCALPFLAAVFSCVALHMMTGNCIPIRFEKPQEKDCFIDLIKQLKSNVS